MLRRFLIALSLASVAVSASAEDSYEVRRDNLIKLSQIFGELHSLRGRCGARGENQAWRDRMSRLLALEEPNNDVNIGMRRAFNSGFAYARDTYRRCDRRASRYASDRAREGERIVQRLVTPLSRPGRADAGQTRVWRGAESSTTTTQ